MSMAGEKLLSETACRGAKPTEKVYYLNDGGGLRLRCKPDSVAESVSTLHYIGCIERARLMLGIESQVNYFSVIFS